MLNKTEYWNNIDPIIKLNVAAHYIIRDLISLEAGASLFNLKYKIFKKLQIKLTSSKNS